MTDSSIVPETGFNAGSDTSGLNVPRETDFERRDADRLVTPAAAVAWIAMGLVAYFWPEHFGAGAVFATEFAVGFTVLGLLLLAGSAAPHAISGKIDRLAPWLLFIALTAEVWLIGPAKTTF